MSEHTFRMTAGPKVEAAKKYHNELPALVPGQHLWVMISMFRVTPGLDTFYLDLENMLTMEGPCCYWCELAWVAGLSEICAGEADS